MQDRLQELIKQRHHGELLVGTAEIVETGDLRIPFVIAATTMRVPMILSDTVNPYLAARAVFLLYRHGVVPSGVLAGEPVAQVISRVAFPGLGTGVGRVDPDTCALQVRAAIDEVVRRTRWQDHAVVIYFVASQEASKIKKLSDQNQVARIVSHATTAGLTAQTIAGEVISEVYVENNFPTKKLAHIAFHEMMHNKLDIGARVVPDLHRIGGGDGLHNTSTTGWASLTSQEAHLVSAHILSRIRQVTTYL